MHFNISQSDFIGAFGRVSPAVPTKSTLPILSNVMMQLDGNILKMVATDLEVSVLTEIEVKGEEDGTISIPAKKIGDITRELEGMDISLKTDESLHLAIKAGDGNYQVPGISSQEFPALPDFEGASKFTIPVKKMDSIIQRTYYAASKDELRPALTGVFFEIKPQEIRAVATDGHRLIRIINQNYKYDGEPKEIIIPVKALDIIKRNLPADGEVSVVMGTNQIMVNLGNTTLYSRLIEGKYPHYESVIPQGNQDKLIVSTELLIQIVRRAQIFSNPISKQIVFDITSNSLEVSAEDIELGGRGSEKIKANYDGEDKTIGYNAAYILDLLKNVDTEEVGIELGGTTQAGIIRPTEQQEGEDFLMLIMPVRLN